MLKQHIQQQPEIRPEVVIVSPMTRAIETAIGAFGGGQWKQGDDKNPLMREQSAVPVSFLKLRTLSFQLQG